MLRSLYSGISGMKVNQTKLDVIGNNIANVGTTAYKAQRARFSTTLSQTVTNSSAPSNNQGGVNASQVGLGVQLASIDSVMTGGNLQSTGRNLDVAIDKTGYFIVSSGPVVTGDNTLQVSHTAGNHSISANSLTTSGSSFMFTRDGSFILDKQGNLVTSDGYRIMGYSLTNDDSSQSATAQNSTPVTCNGMTFSFGPGSQLNGYKVVLGTVGSGTTTSASVDKVSKEIILNGDFSKTSSIDTEAIQTAIDLGLSGAGISQTIKVSGNPNTFENLGSDKVAGGSNAVAPNSVTVGGYILNFESGSKLNGYKFQFATVDGSVPDSVTVNTDEDIKTITINADLINGTSPSYLMNLLNDDLEAQGFGRPIKSVGGSGSSLTNAKTTVGSTTLAELPTMTATNTSNGSTTTNESHDGKIQVANYNIEFKLDDNGKGTALAGYTIKIEEDSNEAFAITIDKSTKAITISGDIASVQDLDKEVNDKLAANRIDAKLEFTRVAAPVTGATGSVKFTGGVDYSNAPNINFLGFDISIQDATTGTGDLDGYTFVVGNINSSNLRVDLDSTNKVITVSGNFTSGGKVKASDLQNEINAKLAGIGKEVKVSGTAQTYSGLVSSKVSGGTELAAPTTIEALGMKFDFSEGAELNGYKIVAGKVARGTELDVAIDEKNKVITINGDFVSGNLKYSDIETTFNSVLLNKGFAQTVTVSGKPMTLSGTESDETMGGTPVQSIAEDGSIYFVSGTSSVSAYDNSLKSIRIPETVKIAGTNEELTVVGYTIDSSGIVNATLEDGSVAALGQIAMATFKNQEGLTRLSGNLFTTSVNSGDAIIMSGVGTLGEDNSLAFGEMVQGYTEMSNVDLAEQFTEMITATRAFKASSKMINTGDEILQDIINLKR